jgi:hypothetical protein
MLMGWEFVLDGMQLPAFVVILTKWHIDMCAVGHIWLYNNRKIFCLMCRANIFSERHQIEIGHGASDSAFWKTTLFSIYWFYFNSPPLWSSGQSFWLQIQRSRVRFPALPDFLTIGCLERGPLSLVITTEELIEKRSSGSGLENRD